MHILRFQPLLRRALWGGTRFGTELGKQLGDGGSFAECWEVADLPGLESAIEDGPLAGLSIRELMHHRARELLGRHLGLTRYPLAVKFLDAADFTSVQVHPADDDLIPPKKELWIILDAQPGSRVIAGLRAGVQQSDLQQALAHDRLAECVHTFEVTPGDVVLIEPGVLHALGAGILAAAVQQPLETAFRIYDWRRLTPAQLPRELQQERGLAAVDYQRGPVQPLVPRNLYLPGGPQQLVDCDAFTVNRYADTGWLALPDDNRSHVLTVVQGTVICTGGDALNLLTGDTVVLPAERSRVTLDFTPGAVLLDSFLQ
ncbi:type I phosphomannose isomerase catalytic subunit [Planctomicrobium sp. SH664]|uniref:type I phosphomannose isomerase catalytic subunit n=1 Tax=Planctomicrobium sp. SH664 TaxID=3448125 RepID=UPI003F5B9DE1